MTRRPSTVPIDDEDTGIRRDEERPGPDSAGQSGDTQGLSEEEGATSQSVAELVEDGQGWEAGIVSGIENAPTPDTVRRVRTREVPEDDVPLEYDERSTDTDEA